MSITYRSLNVLVLLVLSSAITSLGAGASTDPSDPAQTLPQPRAEEFAPGGILAGGFVSNITVYADHVVQCGAAHISWTGTNGAVSLLIGQGGYYIGLTPIETLTDLNGGSTDWTVSQPEGSSLIFEVTDAAGQKGYIQNIKVGESGDESCLSASGTWASSTSSTSGLVEGTSTRSQSTSKSGDDPSRSTSSVLPSSSSSARSSPTSTTKASASAKSSTTVSVSSSPSNSAPASSNDASTLISTSPSSSSPSSSGSTPASGIASSSSALASSATVAGAQANISSGASSASSTSLSYFVFVGSTILCVLGALVGSTTI